jgi:hypothetical protein
MVSFIVGSTGWKISICETICADEESLDTREQSIIAACRDET